MRASSVFTVILCGILMGCGNARYVTVEPTPGPKGKDGSSCSVSRVSGGAVIACTDGTSALVVDGADGINGLDGANGADGQPAALNPLDIVEIMNPCGDAQGFDEILLKLRDGTILAHYSHGSRQFLVELSPGAYTTTDGQSCTFTLTAEGTLL